MFFGGGAAECQILVNCGPGDARGGFGLPGVDFGAQNRAKGSFGVPFVDGFWILLGSVFEVLFWKASGSRFLRFWDDSGFIFGVVFVTFWTQKGSLHKIIKNLFLLLFIVLQACRGSRKRCYF